MQAIPAEIREEAANVLPTLLKPEGRLISIGREATDRTEEVMTLPWPLSRKWLMEKFSSLDVVIFQAIVLEDWPDIDRYIGVWQRTVQ